MKKKVKIIYIKIYINEKVVKHLYSWLDTKKNSKKNSQVNKIMIYLKSMFKNLDRRLKVC